MKRADLFRSAVTGAMWATLTVAAAIPLFIWGSDNAQEFYGAFTAAIVAAIAVILGAYYQSEFTRRRDDTIRKQNQLAEATELYYWLEHAALEMEFIATVLERMRSDLADKREKAIAMPLEQFREVVSAKFMSELRDRAAIAARLPVGGFVARVLYKTFSAVDRVYLFRGATDSYQQSTEQFENHIDITRRRITQLREAAASIREYLVENGVWVPTIDD